MPYRLFNGNANVVSKIITTKRTEKNLSYSELSNKLALLGITLYKSDLFMIENNKRLVRDFELIAICEVLEIKFQDLLKCLEI